MWSMFARMSTAERHALQTSMYPQLPESDNNTNWTAMGAVIPTNRPSSDGVTATSDQLGFILYRFEASVMLIGAIGFFANACVLLAIVKSKQGKNRAFNELLMNQSAQDMFSCTLLVISYAFLALENTQAIGYWPCMLFANENLLYWGLWASKINLISVSFERYVKIVHPIWHRNKAKPWMTHAAMCVSWFISISISCSLSFTTTLYVEGVCIINATWPSELFRVMFGVCTFVLFFVTVLFSIIFCYGNILAVLRRQARVNTVQHANSQPVAAKAMQEDRAQRKTIKTMIIIAVAFVICWTPCDLYLTIVYLLGSHLFIKEIYQVTLFMAFCNVCLNPFIYAANYDVVSNKLMSWVKCGKTMTANRETTAVTG